MEASSIPFRYQSLFCWRPWFPPGLESLIPSPRRCLVVDTVRITYRDSLFSSNKDDLFPRAYCSVP